jgi:hypothetical protein
MAVQALYALQNGFLGFERAGLFYGDRAAERVAIPVTCYLVRTGDATILFDTGISPRALPGSCARIRSAASVTRTCWCTGSTRSGSSPRTSTWSC